MKTPYTPGPWKMEIYLNEKDAQQPPHIVGLRDNHQVADCCGADDMDIANGRLIATAPELLQACEAALVALTENSPDCPPSEANLKAAGLCRAARDKAHAA
ncbi:MAG: hypothetical protein EPO02_06655 [Nitrospirae bacterium]|nr:MAG: hypothetical protein EPO02_06655 [Nitrospirota bacterium]